MLKEYMYVRQAASVRLFLQEKYLALLACSISFFGGHSCRHDNFLPNAGVLPK